MTPTKVPYLCGGILFSLILQARKTRIKARDKFNSGSDGLKDTDVMMGLVKVVKVVLSENALRSLRPAKITGLPISLLLTPRS